MLREYNLFQPLFPTITRYFTENGDSAMERMIAQVLKNTDTRIHNDMRVNPAFLFAAMFWYPLLETAQRITQESGLAYYDAFALAANDVLDEGCRTLAIPKRITTLVRDIWQLQLRMSRRQGKRAWKLMEHPKFRAAFDLPLCVLKSKETRSYSAWRSGGENFRSLHHRSKKICSRISMTSRHPAVVTVARASARRVVKAQHDPCVYCHRQQSGLSA